MPRVRATIYQVEGGVRGLRMPEVNQLGGHRLRYGRSKLPI